VGGGGEEYDKEMILFFDFMIVTFLASVSKFLQWPGEEYLRYGLKYAFFFITHYNFVFRLSVLSDVACLLAEG
jgi:hypothetical protein